MLRAIGTNSGTARATTSVQAIGRPQEASSSSAQSPAPDGLRASGAEDWSSGSSSALSLMESAPQLVPDREKKWGLFGEKRTFPSPATRTEQANRK